MLENQMTTRRTFFRESLFFSLGAALGALGVSCRRQTGGKRLSTAVTDTPPFEHHNPDDPSLAVSLTVLQEQVATQRRPAPRELTQLAGMARIQTIMLEPNGEVLLLGDPASDTSLAPLEFEALVIALRNAYQDTDVVHGAYRGVLGCTIDPWEETEDLWAIQKVGVFGMPHSTSMAFRHVALDYALKKVSVGMLAFGNEVPSLWAMSRAASPFCAGSVGNSELSHRFWYAVRYPEAPRFLADGNTVLIRKPVAVQLLTEQMFLSQTGRQTGSAPADPVAEQFARNVSAALLTDTLPAEYLALRNDFRLIEVAHLLRFQHAPAASLRYLLRNYPLTEQETPRFVGGIRREEQREIVCETKLREERVSRGIQVHGNERVERYHVTSRGGVEAKVEVVPEHIEQADTGQLADLRARVRESRPTAKTLAWVIQD